MPTNLVVAFSVFYIVLDYHVVGLLHRDKNVDFDHKNLHTNLNGYYTQIYKNQKFHEISTNIHKELLLNKISKEMLLI